MKDDSKLKRYKDPKDQLEKRAAYRKETAKRITFELRKEKDAELIEYFENAGNKVEALRTLFATYQRQSMKVSFSAEDQADPSM